MAALALALAGCVPASTRIHQHELRGAAFAARGLDDAAAGERLRANREREQLSRAQTSVFSRDGH